MRRTKAQLRPNFRLSTGKAPEGKPMDQPVKSPAQRALEDAFRRACSSCRGRRRRRPWPSGSTGWRGCARRSRTTKPRFEQAISADFGHRSQHRDRDRRDLARARRDQARRQTSEEMDGAAAGRDRAAIPAGQKPPDAAAARRGRHHRAVELSAAVDAGAGGRRAGRRQPGDDQAERTGAAVLGAAGASDRGEIRRHRDDRDRHRGRDRASRSPRCRSII